MTERETLAYLAGIIDGEGCIRIKKAKAYRCQGRTTASYHAAIQVRMVERGALDLLEQTLGGWHYREDRPTCRSGRALHCYQATDQSAAGIIRKLLPFLRIKRRQALLVLKLVRLKARSGRHRTKVTGTRNFPNQHGTARTVNNLSLSDEFVGWCESLYLRCKKLNAVGVAALA